MAQSYKSLKEDFVSNLSGGSIWEINCVTAVAPAAVLLWSALQSRRNFFSNTYASFLTDFLLNVGAILVATTIYSSAPIVLNIFLILPAYFIPKSSCRTKKPNERDGNLHSIPVRPFITHYRGSMMVITCIAILAVDFKIFPRRFAKVETWGTSLMDMGVGSFVFSAGLISARPLLKTGATSLKSALRHSLPLLALGLIRLYSVKGLDYAEHVSEYGVHWNFFFTLALLPPSVALLHLNPHLMALSISCLLQTVLDFTSLKDWILTAPRNNLISQNREGLFSFFGYLSIFLIGQAIGFDILPRNRDNIRIKMTLLMRLFLWSAWFSLLLFLTSYRTLVSRRLANLPYVLWVSAFNCAQLALFCTIESLLFPGLYSSADQSTESRKCKNATSLVLGSFNRNGLAIFLLANLLTGFVNLSMDTLNANRITSMTVLIVYVGSLTIIATTLHRYNISIKF